MTETAALAFGSNIGDKTANIEAALSALDGYDGLRVILKSAFYRTEPWGLTDQDWFVNACALVETALGARDLLRVCKDIETDLGRAPSVRWGPRLIDVDIIAISNTSLADPDLVIPHRSATERAFVLVPLCEIAPETDLGGLTAGQALQRIDTAGIEKMELAG